MARPWTLAPLALLLAGCGSEEPATLSGVAPPAHTGPALPVVPPLSVPLVGPLPAPPLATGDGWHTDFARAFTDGLVIERPEEKLRIEVAEAGELSFEEEDRVRVMDPLGVAEPVELPIRVPIGGYRIQVSRVHIVPRDGSAPGTEIAAARMIIGKGRAKTWRWVGDYAVDSGLGAFLSHRAAEALARRRPELAQRMANAVERDPLVAMVMATRPAAPTDLAFFPAGAGDRAAEVYVGLDAEGLGVEIVADFQVLLQPVEAVHLFQNPAIWPPGLLPEPELEALGIEVRRAHPGETVPATGAPVWIAIDARSIARDARMGFPRVQARDTAGDPVPIDIATEGYRIWVPMSSIEGKDIATLAVIVQIGVEPL